MPLATNAEILNGQLAACLAVVNNTGHALELLSSANEKDTPTEAEVSLELTIMSACDRLDQILKNDALWKLPDVDGHRGYEEIAKHQAAGLDLANQLKANEVFVADYNKQVALRRLQAIQEPQPTKKNARRKK